MTEALSIIGLIFSVIALFSLSMAGYYIIKDLDGNEVVDDDLYDEIVAYFEGEEGELIDPFSFDEYEEDYD